MSAKRLVAGDAVLFIWYAKSCLMVEFFLFLIFMAWHICLKLLLALHFDESIGHVLFISSWFNICDPTAFLSVVT